MTEEHKTRVRPPEELDRESRRVAELEAPAARGGEAIAGAHERSKMLEPLVAYCPDGVALLDRNFNFVSVNEAYARACQRHPSEFPGQSYFELCPFDGREILEQVVRTKQPFTARARPLVFRDRPDGAITYWDWTLVPIPNDTGEVDLLLFMLREVTEPKLTEQSLSESRGEMELWVKEGSAELARADKGLHKEISEHRRAEQALRESEERYKVLYDNAVVAMFRTSIEDGQALAVNDVGVRLFGYSSKEEFLSKFKASEHYMDPDGRKKLLEELRSKGEVRNYRTRLSRQDGTAMWVEFSARIYPEKGYIEGVVIDITERMWAERALRFTQFSIDHCADAAFWMGSDARFIYVNDAACRALEYSRRELLSMTVHDIDPDFPPEAWPDHWNELKQHGSLTIESRHRTKDGHVFPVEICANFLEFEGKEYNCAFARDIAGRKRVEQALRRSEETARALLNAPADPSLLLTRDGTILALNDGAIRALGRPVEEVLGRCIYDFFTPDLAASRKSFVDRVLQTGKPVRFEDEMSGLVFDNTIYPVFDESGAVDRVAVVAIDITLRRQAEKENLALEKRVLRAQRLESPGVLAGGIAHDFNNLLTGVLGNISLAKKDSACGEEALACLDAAEKAALRAQDLTLQLLTFSEGGEPVKRAVSIADVVSDSARFAVRGSNARLVLFFADDLCPVDVDVGQIGRVMHSLILNAHEAMPDGGGEIKISAENVTVGQDAEHPLDRGKYVRITVADQGTGIAQEYVGMVFDPYFTTKSGHSGLGLATCYSIIKRHGGHIAVQSAVGAGTVFSIYLPACDKQVCQEPDNESVPCPAAKNPAHGR